MRTAKWTPRWFNKPKFHILLHLPTHIRRFGPASLFATEPFESFNALIRAKIIHSNRLAPSHDIAVAFAHTNRVRHLLSGGYHHVRHGEESSRYSCSFKLLSTPARVAVSGISFDAGEAGVWRRGAPGPLRLIEEHAVIRSYLGLDAQSNSNQFGTCLSLPSCPLSNLVAPCSSRHLYARQIGASSISPNQGISVFP
jgi:hypothetical protein